MRMKSLILIFIALGCGLVASIGISQVMDRGGGSTNVETEQILVTLSDIDIGSKFSAQNVKLEDWPKAKIPEGAIRRLEDAKDKFATSRFYKGEPLHSSKIADQLGNYTNNIPSGYRAMPVKIEEDTVMKAVAPGDKVDVMVFLRRNPPEIMETGAFTLLRNVRVFAINTNTERSTDTKGETTNFRTVSLLIKDDYCGELVVAAKMGNIFLTLRRPDDADKEGGEEVTPIKEILAGKSKAGSEPLAQSGPAVPFVEPAGQDTPAHESGPRPLHSMLLMGPKGNTVYDWFDPKGLPTQSTLKSGAPAPAAAPVTPATPGDAPDSKTEGNPTTGDDAGAKHSG